MAWLYLILAGTFEMLGVTSINKFNEKKNVWTVFYLISSFFLSFLFLSFAMETISMGTAYAVWTGIGAVGGAIIGIIYYGESKDWKRIVFIFIIITAVIGLKMIS
jgi:paired small multidrug resistance pump